MAVTAPEWLKQRDGDLKRSPVGATWLVLLTGTPQYKLTVTPAKGQFTCIIQQAVNGKLVDAGATYPGVEEAVSGGLEQLRGKLGW